MAYPLVADISSYQPSDANFFMALKNAGVKAVIVKITEGSNPGTAYISPKAQTQITNARNAGLRVHGYHFARYNGNEDARNEAAWFVKNAKALGLAGDSYMLADVEASSDNASQVDGDTTAFLNAVKAAGFPLVGKYSMASWFWNGRITVNGIPGLTWVANYGGSQPGVDNTDLWQFTDAFAVGGVKLDMSYDFKGLLTGAATTTNASSISTQVKTTTDPNNQWTDTLGDTWHSEDGTFTSNQAINLRWGAKISSAKITTLPAGSVVKYDAWSNHDGYVWIRQPRGNGQFAYMVVRDARTKEAFGSFK